MPVILSQHFSPSDRIYLDVEGALYHYPRQYFARFKPYDRFIYYRPLGTSQPRPDSKTYFGHGILGESYPDYHRPDHRFVDLIAYEPFPELVPLVDPQGKYYETGTETPPRTQAAVREISEIAYHRVLAQARVSVTGVSLLPTTEVVAGRDYRSAPVSMPKESLRTAEAIPEGAGYSPRDGITPNVYESASLHERARADHQLALRAIASAVTEAGGQWWYNNHIDLFAEARGQRLLIEAKSLTREREAVDRMRYGIGQLVDYSIRYRTETEGARRVLAFGNRPSYDASWISTLLDEAGIDFIAAGPAGLAPLNVRARQILILC